MTRTGARYAAFALCMILTAIPAAAAQGNLKHPSPAPASAAQAADRGGRADDENARDTRDRLINLLRQYPPSLSEVLRLDPSLLTNEAYLAPYPALAAFLKQHPEVAHNPSFRKLVMVENMMTGFARVDRLHHFRDRGGMGRESAHRSPALAAALEGADRGPHEAARSLH